jgi:hypothetical protein
MALKIETFSSLKGGNSFFKAVTHPETAGPALALVRRLASARSVAVYDPLGFATGFAALRDLAGVTVAGVYVQAVTDLGQERLGHGTRPVTELARSGADLVFVAAFDAERLVQQIAHLLPAGAEVVTLDVLRLDPRPADQPAQLSGPAQFRDQRRLLPRSRRRAHPPGHGELLVELRRHADLAGLTLFDAGGQVLAQWREPLAPGQSAVVIDSRRRARPLRPAGVRGSAVHPCDRRCRP